MEAIESANPAISPTLAPPVMPPQKPLSKSQRKIFTCEVCSKAFSHCWTLKRHSMLHTNPIRCPTCFKPFTCKGTLSKHYLIHTGEKPHKCNLCGRGFRAKSDLNQHILTHTGERPYPCQVCGKLFGDRSSRKKHYLIHTGEKPYICEFCSKGFSEKAHLKDHYVTHTGQRDHLCEVCNKRFTTKSSLQRHYATHVDIKPYVCDVCDRAFKRRNALQDHYTTHNNNKPYECPICGKKFSRRYDVNLHAVTHTNDRPHTCDKCGRAFKLKRTLRQHYIRHSSDRPFKCEDCGLGFFTPSNLYEHKLTHTDNNPFQCTFCDIVFSSKDTMKRHFKKQHGMIHTLIDESQKCVSETKASSKVKKNNSEVQQSDCKLVPDDDDDEDTVELNIAEYSAGVDDNGKGEKVCDENTEISNLEDSSQTVIETEVDRYNCKNYTEEYDTENCVEHNSSEGYREINCTVTPDVFSRTKDYEKFIKTDDSGGQRNCKNSTEEYDMENCTQYKTFKGYNSETSCTITPDISRKTKDYDELIETEYSGKCNYSENNAEYNSSEIYLESSSKSINDEIDPHSVLKCDIKSGSDECILPDRDETHVECVHVENSLEYDSTDESAGESILPDAGKFSGICKVETTFENPAVLQSAQ